MIFYIYLKGSYLWSCHAMCSIYKDQTEKIKTLKSLLAPFVHFIISPKNKTYQYTFIDKHKKSCLKLVVMSLPQGLEEASEPEGGFCPRVLAAEETK